MAVSFKAVSVLLAYRRPMAWVDDGMLERAGRFLWTSGRVLEQRRFTFLFGDTGDPAGVLAALDAYGPPEGGYAFGLEPDVRGPVAQPISVPAALRVLEETGALHGARARRLCDWLAGVTAADGGVPAVLPTLRPYPRPPWLPIAEEPAGDLLATPARSAASAGPTSPDRAQANARRKRSTPCRALGPYPTASATRRRNCRSDSPRSSAGNGNGTGAGRLSSATARSTGGSGA